MGIDIDAGRILCTNAGGVVRLDTDQALFHTIPPLVSGTVSISARNHSAGMSAAAELQDTWIASCHASCTHVIGSVEFSAASAHGIGHNRATTYLGGDLVWIHTSQATNPANAGGAASWANIMVLYSFFCNAGGLYLRQHIRLPDMTTGVPPGTVLTVAAHTIKYDLECGLFT